MGTLADGRYNRPGPHVQLKDPDGWYDEPWWQLNHGFYGVVVNDGRARWCVEAIDGFTDIEGGESSAGYRRALDRIDQHCSAVSHIVAHHGGCDETGIRLRIDAQGGELVVSSFDSFQPLGVIHADGSFSLESSAILKVEPYTGLRYR